MEITKDNNFTEFLLKKIAEEFTYDDARTGNWHVSDLLFPRFAVFSRLDKRPPDAEAIGYFFTGVAYHRAIQDVLGRQNSEIRVEALKITGTADFFDNSMLIEFKTSRKWTVPDAPEKHYVQQARYYAALFRVHRVYIVVIYPTAGRKWDGSQASTVDIATWVVNFTDEDIKNIEQELVDKRRAMTAALQSGDVSNLPKCPAFKFGRIQENKETKLFEINVRCPYAEKCRCGEELYAEAERKNKVRLERQSKLQTRRKPRTES